MSKVRDFNAVLSDVMGVIPEEEVELIGALIEVKRAAGFRAPEARAIDWVRLESTLVTHLGHRKEEPFAQLISRIVTGEGTRYGQED